MIVGFSEIEDISGNRLTLADTCDLKEGDRIVSVSETEIKSIEDLKNKINESKGNSIKATVIDINLSSKGSFTYDNSY